MHSDRPQETISVECTLAILSATSKTRNFYCTRSVPCLTVRLCVEDCQGNDRRGLRFEVANGPGWSDGFLLIRSWQTGGHPDRRRSGALSHRAVAAGPSPRSPSGRGSRASSRGAVRLSSPGATVTFGTFAASRKMEPASGSRPDGRVDALTVSAPNTTVGLTVEGCVFHCSPRPDCVAVPHHMTN